MQSSPTPITFAALPGARTAYGRGTAVWATHGLHQVEHDWWIALSRTPYVDYNLALLHGDGAVDAAPHVLEVVTAARVPAVVMLAGHGLHAAEVLRDTGWVCTDALPFMGKGRGPTDDDPGCRLLGPDDLAQARHLVAQAFGVPDEVGAVVYADDALTRDDVRLWGLFDGHELRCCSASQYVDGTYSVGWALATDPAVQRAGFARRLLRASGARRQVDGIPVALLMATPAGRRLYEQEGYVTLEHWQIWSRPRWVLP